MDRFILAYFVAIALSVLTVGWAASLAKKSGQRLYQAFFSFVIVNALVAVSDVLLHLFPAWVGSKSGGLGGLLSGFVVFPLLAAFSFFVVDFQLALVNTSFPKLLKRAYAGFWGLLFLGFLAAEFRQIVDREMGLANILQPLFNIAIVASGLGSSIFVLKRRRIVQDPGGRRFAGTIAGYLLIAFLVFGTLNYLPAGIDPVLRILVRSFLGLAYLLPLLAWLQARFGETKSALLTRLAGDMESVDRWLESGSLSPRERQITRRVLEGKSNAAIGKELFIGARTVESHLYSIYRKLGVKNRLQVARLAAAQSEGGDQVRNG